MTRMLALLFALMCSSLAWMQAAEKAWISFDTADLNEDWQLRVSTDRADLIPHRAAATARIAFIAGKSSSSYSAALSQICRDFAAQDRYFSADLYNFQKNTEAGREWLSSISQQKPDLIIALGSEAMALACEASDGRIPVLCTTCKDPVRLSLCRDYQGSGTHIAFSSLNIDPRMQLNYVRQLMPDLRAIAVCYNNQRGLVIKAEIEPMREIYEAAGIRFIPVEVAGRKNVAAQLSEAIPDALDELAKIDPSKQRSLFWVSSCTGLFPHVGHIQGLAPGYAVLSENPALVQESLQDTSSAVLSIGIDRRNNAHIAALYALRILDGIDPGELPVGISNPPDIAINLAEAKKCSLQLPFRFIEAASFIFDQHGRCVRSFGRALESTP